MAAVTVTVHHSTTTNAAANPNVLVDGPKWDAAHTTTVSGLENVPNVDTTNPANLTFTQTGTGASAVTLDSLFRSALYTPEMFAGGATISAAWGTAAASVPDAATAMQRCANALSAIGGGFMWLKPGRVYGVIGSVQYPANVFVKGGGIQSTVVLHKPTSNTTCFYFGSGTATQTYNGGVFDLVIASADTTYVKIAISVYDFSFFRMKNVSISGYPLNSNLYFSDATSSSVGLYIQGREHGVVRQFQSAADYPLRVAANPNAATLSLDSWTFTDFAGYASGATRDVITFDSGVVCTNNTFNGQQNWIGGRDGFHWVDTSSAAISQGLYLSGIKSEQAADATGYVVNIQHNTGLYGLHIADEIGGDRNGVKLRKARTSEIQNFYFDPAGASRVGLDLDSTDSFCQLIGCTWLPGTTATITGLTLNETNGIITGHSSAVPSSGIYVVTGSGAANITGNAGTATAIAVTDDIATNATMYPAFVSATTGNLGAKSSSTKLTFNPFTGTLNAIFFGGDGSNLSGTAAALTAGHVTTNANLTGDVTSVGNATTLATVNSNVGTFGSATQVAVPTVDGKGRITAISNTTISGTAPGGAAGGDLGGTYPNPTINNAPVIAKVLTGYVSGAGTVAATDTILQAIQKLNGNDATNANLTGDVTSVGNATTLTNAPVIAKVLTGYTSGAGTVSASDSILSAIQKLNGNDATNANLTGDVTSVGNATTLTNAPVIAKVLTGYTSGAGTVSASDSILTAIQKLNGNDATNANLTGLVTSVGNATSLALGQLTNSLSGDVSLNNTANYFTGPTIAQGSTGTWFASGQVTLLDTAGAATFFAKLWDGTTIIASGSFQAAGANILVTIALSGYLATPAGNLRIDVNDSTATTGKIKASGAGTNSSIISAFRLA